MGSDSRSARFPSAKAVNESSSKWKLVSAAELFSVVRDLKKASNKLWIFASSLFMFFVVSSIFLSPSSRKVTVIFNIFAEFSALYRRSTHTSCFSYRQMLKDVVVRQILRDKIEADLDLSLAQVVCCLKLALK
jgi:hypothetical protein